MTLFVLSQTCQSRIKCHLCRDGGDVGKQFREAHAQTHEMPGDGLFPCPFGVTAETASKPPLPKIPFGVQCRLWLFRFVAILIVWAIRCRWLRWALVQEEDRGAGDTIARWITQAMNVMLWPMRAVYWMRGRALSVCWRGRTSAEIYKAVYRRVTGRDCGCGDIQGKLNAEFPY